MKSSTLLFWGMIVASLLATCLSPTLTMAQTDVWLGGKGSWNDGSMWSAGVPTSGSDVFIDNGNKVISTATIDGQVACHNLTVDSADGLALIKQKVQFGSVGRLVINGTFTNFSGGTLTGGSYKLTGGGTLIFNDANIVTNAAKIHLGIKYAILDQHGNDALANLSSTTRQGTLLLDHLSKLTTPGPYSNAGKLILRSFSQFTVNGIYTQSAGLTWIRSNATLNAPSGVTIQGGQLFGSGGITATSGMSIQAGQLFGTLVIAGNVTSSGSITPGGTPTVPDPGTLSLHGTYTQNSAGSLNSSIFSDSNGRLAVSSGVSLNGTLNINVFSIPPVGSTFTILTGSPVNGQFSTVNGLSINNSEHFEITYNPTNVILTVVAGPQ